MSFTFFFLSFLLKRIAFQTIKFHQGQKHNPLNANCNAVGGPANLKAVRWWIKFDGQKVAGLKHWSNTGGLVQVVFLETQ